jgi:hypothetical protein
LPGSWRYTTRSSRRRDKKTCEAGSLTTSPGWTTIDAPSASYFQSRRPDSNRRPLHYEGKTSEGRASTRVHARARFSWRSDGFTALQVDARARPCPSSRTRFVPRSHQRQTRDRRALDEQARAKQQLGRAPLQVRKELLEIPVRRLTRRSRPRRRRAGTGCVGGCRVAHARTRARSLLGLAGNASSPRSGWGWRCGAG